MTKQTVITFDEDGTDYITGESVSFTLNNAEELCQATYAIMPRE